MKYIYTETITKELDIPYQLEQKIKELYEQKNNHEEIMDYLFTFCWDYLFKGYERGELINNNLIE